MLAVTVGFISSYIELKNYDNQGDIVVTEKQTKHYREVVSDYPEENEDTLPKIAVCETLVKLTTEKK